MKNILFVRHAKSSWSSPHIEDINRPLNHRGQRDAPIMARILIQYHSKIDLLICSPSQRTRDTAAYFKEAYQLEDHKILIWDQLYHGSIEDYQEVIMGLSENYNDIVIIGHNPTMTYIANLNNPNYIDNVATCGILYFKYASSWLDFDMDQLEFVDYKYPKMYL